MAERNSKRLEELEEQEELEEKDLPAGRQGSEKSKMSKKKIEKTKVKAKVKVKLKVKIIAKDKIFRILDANLNRATEGLRVAEDIVRFVMNDEELTKRLKEIRHELVDLMKDKSWELRGARRVKSDVGANKTILAESKRKNLADVFTSNIKRSEEAVRVFEELAKLFDPELGPKFKKMRFELYEIEQRASYRLKQKKK